MAIYQLIDEPYFPDPREANADGLLAVGGDLSPQRLISAYASGIFPWFHTDKQLMWWSPDPRMVLFPDKFKVSKSLRQIMRRNKFELKIDTAFIQVITNCKTIERKGQPGTWITSGMRSAYIQLHELGLAHSFESWMDGQLVGGLYGVSLGKVFFGESMFSKVSDASKIAFYHLSQFCLQHHFPFIDCQVPNDHLASLGADEIPRTTFLELLQQALQEKTWQGKW